MSSLTDAEKRYFETLLDMGDGYVLDFTNKSFGELFYNHHIDIHSERYQTYGTSKAKKLRSFWEQESDEVVGPVLSEMLDVYENNTTVNENKASLFLLEKVRGSVCRLLGEPQPAKTTQIGDALAKVSTNKAQPNILGSTVRSFKNSPVTSAMSQRLPSVFDDASREKGRDVALPDIPEIHRTTHSERIITNKIVLLRLDKLPLRESLRPVIESRLREIELTLKAGAHLSTIFLCGSVLEAVLLGAAHKEPARFNRAQGSPKSADGRVRRFHEWNLAQLIDVACEIGVLKPDVKKFSHGLRDFRNYIHPYEQMASGFTPDHYTAQVCFQVLKAACASIAGERA